LDIFSVRPDGLIRVIIPWLKSAANGSSTSISPILRITRAKNRA
jgi:hypothetical protein